MALSTKKKTPTPKPDRPSAAAARRFMGSGPIYRNPGVPYYSAWDTERAITDGMLRSIWTFKAIDSIAKSGSGLPIDLRTGPPVGEQETVDWQSAPNLWRRLNLYANPWESAAGFRYRLLTQLMLSRKGVFIEYESDKDGQITAMFLLHPDKTAPIPDETNFVSGFETQVNGIPVIVPAERVLWIRIPHPTDPYLSLTPLDAAGLSIDLDYYSRLYNRNFMANDGRPGGIVSVQGSLNEEDATELQARFAGGVINPGRVSVIESEGLDFIDLATTPRDAAYRDLRTGVKEEILIAFGVPESQAGNASGRTYDNADAEENVFWRITMLPTLNIVGTAFGSITPGGTDDDMWVAHNIDNVQALQRPVREAEQRLMEQFQQGAITLDELREDGLKRAKVGRPGSATFYLPAGRVGIGADDTEVAGLAKVPIVGAPGGAPGAPGAAPGGFDGLGADEPPALGQGEPGAPQGSRIGMLLANLRNPGTRPALPGSVGPTNLPGMPTEAKVLPFATKADRFSHNSILLAVPYDAARGLLRRSPVRATDPTDAHITMVMFDAPRFDDKALDVITDWAARTAPLDLTIGPDTTTFPEDSDGTPWVYAVHSPALLAARQDLRDSLLAADVAVSEHPEYQPHMTIAYLPSTNPEPPDLADAMGLNHTFGDITTTWGSNAANDTVRIPLVGEPSAAVPAS